ncbi:MAG: ATP-dependent helicase [Methanoregula sp.]|jgi:DNA helicase-2/ATP-dependent DNA helicase PcrA|uniref:ATP-dependent helicase n=1 Tax=Methanoregula sp. TaxID=2052170 RepID=UPI0025EDD8E9|nr:ATP-dependent helicase [Methanoregula sp.]MCK9632764.1 ATP-dependent helicase [Methanoregula sp.]
MWDEGLLDEQKIAASHCGSHACLLAGPGTGKTRTLQRHVVFLINEKNVPPNQILALTFTRAAAFELRKRIAEIIGEEHALPRVSTIHSFALRQILKNADTIQSIPKPLRIADDWEERNIIFEDLKDILSSDIKTISKKFNLLSADWQTLDAEKERWEERFPDPTFLGAWHQHRKIYGYTLREELVYQLKRSLEQTDNFSLESDYLHLLVDEYQDLNRCDMGIVFALRDRGMEVYAAGDDDQSIYGFRFALPKGIRRFNEDFDPSQFLTLKICVRCDKNIIRLATFVANLDPSRIKKPLNPMPDASTGAVHILRFEDQDNEAKGIATICNYLIKKKGIPPNEIFILTRSDRHGLFSSNIRDALVSRDLPVTVPDTDSILDTDEGRKFIALLNLLENPEDNLALRTILHIERNRIGKKSYAKIYELANQVGITFSQAAYKIQHDSNLIPRDGKKIAGAIDFINKKISIHTKMIELFERSVDRDEIFESLIHFVEDIIPDSENKSKLTKYIKTVIDETDPSDFKNLIQILSATVNEIEQALDPEKINIMTMHKAKGLTATAVILAACEDEYIPGRQTEEMEGDERRLLYVSLSRAKKFLYITYCNQRTGQQTHTGRSFGNAKRTLTRFLWDAPNKPLSGQKYVEKLKI